MTEFESILQSVMYHDRASIYRLVPGKAADGSDDYEDEETLVAEDVPFRFAVEIISIFPPAVISVAPSTLAETSWIATSAEI